MTKFIVLEKKGKTEDPEGYIDFVCTGMCGYSFGKLIHPHTKETGLPIDKNCPILRLYIYTIKLEP